MQVEKILLSRADVQALLGISRQTMERYLKAEVLPARVVINQRKKGWLREDIETWLQQRKERRSRK